MSSSPPARQLAGASQPAHSRAAPGVCSAWLALHWRILAAELGLLLGVLALTIAVREAGRGPLPGDVGLTLWWQHLMLPHPWLAAAVESVSTINFPLPAALLIVVVTAMLLLLRRRLDILISLGTLAVADGTNFLLNALVRRPRPGGHGIVVQAHITTDFSFPSGHVEHAVAYLGVLVFLSFQIRRPVGHWTARLLWTFRVILLVSIVLMQPSRVLEGEHWPSDGLAAWFEGLFWLLLAIQMYAWASRRWPELLGMREPRPSPQLADGNYLAVATSWSHPSPTIPPEDVGADARGSGATNGVSPARESTCIEEISTEHA